MLYRKGGESEKSNSMLERGLSPEKGGGRVGIPSGQAKKKKERLRNKKICLMKESRFPRVAQGGKNKLEGSLRGSSKGESDCDFDKSA